jgi:hypothetical protein
MAATISQIFRSRNRVHGKKSQETNDPRIFCPSLLASNKSVGIIQIFKSRFHFASPFHHLLGGFIGINQTVAKSDLSIGPFAASHGDEPSPVSLPSN